MAEQEAVDEDIKDLRERFLNREFEEVTFEIDGTRFAEYAKVCGETAAKFTDPDHPDFQAPPTYVSTLVGGRNTPPDFPRLGGMGMDAGKGVEWKAPVRDGATLTGRSHLHDIYTKTGRSGRMVFFVNRMEIFDSEGQLLASADTSSVVRERPEE